MRNIIISLLIMIIFLACSGKDKLPDGVLDSEKMEVVMWDIIRADEVVNERVRKDSTLNKKEESLKLYDQVFAIHKISKDNFDKSLNYYQSRPDRLKPIFDSLSSHEATITGEKYKPVPVEDTAIKGIPAPAQAN